jgi:carbon monoxide dehydrogenase subunit G
VVTRTRYPCAKSRIVAPVRVEESAEIARSSRDVWEFVVDPMNDPRWCRKVKSVERAGPRHWKVIHKPVPLRPSATLSLEQLELDPPRRVTMREEGEASVFDVEYRLEETPTGTRFTQVSEFKWKKLPRALHKTFERGVRRDVRRQLRALKGVLERAGESTSSAV